MIMSILLNSRPFKGPGHEELIKIDLLEEGKETKHVFLGASLSAELVQAILDPLNSKSKCLD